MGVLIGFFVRLYTMVFGALERLTNGWFIDVNIQACTSMGYTRDELLALAEIGHLTGLRDRIVQARDGGQLDHKLAENMHSLLKVFDFQAAIRLLETTP